MKLKRSVVRHKPRRAKKPRKTEIGLWREWLVPDGAYHRFKGLRGIYWYWLSRDVRQKEWEKWNTICLTCLEPIESWEYADCGHIVSSAKCGEFLRLNPINLTIQHKKCNNPRFTPDNDALNAIHYDKRYFAGAWENLYAMRKTFAMPPKKWEYADLIRNLDSYQNKLSQLIENKP